MLYLSLAITILSLICQIVAAWIAWRIATKDRLGWGWGLLTVAMLVMALRRAVVLVGLASGSPSHLPSETLGLVISITMLGGVLLIKPVLEASRRFQTFMEMETHRLNSILQELPGVVYRCQNNPQWPMEFISEGCRELTGYSPDALIGNQQVAYAELILPEDRSWVWQEIEKAIEERRPYRLVYRIRTAAGQIKWVWERGSAVFSEEGEVLYLQGFITDVTVWRNSEEELRKAWARWKEDKAQWTAEEDRLLRQIWNVQEHQSEMIAYEIHDGFVQFITAALMNLESYRHLRETSPQEAEVLLDKAIQLIRNAIEEARRLIHGLRPVRLEEGGLIPALEELFRQFQERYRVQIEFVDQTEFVRLAAPLETNVYRIIQEAVRNALRHSGSPQILVRLWQEGSQLLIEVRDWGKGFDPHVSQEGHFGVTSIRDRARLLGGRAEIESRPGQGTTVRVTIPLDQPENADASSDSQSSPRVSAQS